MQGETKAQRQARERREAEKRNPDKTVQRKNPSRQTKDELLPDWDKAGKHINLAYFRQSVGLLFSRILLAAFLVYGAYLVVTDIFPKIEDEVIAQYVKGKNP